ncbi:MAG: hypothetical protein U0075_07975 [Thermomicrobiales bacterium]
MIGVNDLADAEFGARAVDCGGQDNHAAVATARGNVYLDVIIVDHHRIIEAPPERRSSCPRNSTRNLLTWGCPQVGGYLVAVALSQSGFDAGDGSGVDRARCWIWR